MHFWLNFQNNIYLLKEGKENYTEIDKSIFLLQVASAKCFVNCLTQASQRHVLLSIRMMKAPPHPTLQRCASVFGDSDGPLFSSIIHEAWEC